MTMRALVERNNQANPDGYGHPDAPNWVQHIASLACWLYTQAKQEVIDAEKNAVVEDIRMLVPRGTDITEQDRINGVVDRRGTSIRAGIMSIRAVINRRSHLELVLEGGVGS